MLFYALALLAASPAAVQYLNAMERLDAGNAPAAEQLARESTPGIGPLQPYGELLLGRALAAQGKHEEALLPLRAAQAADPSGPLGRRAGAALAASLKALGREADAVAALPTPRRDELELRLVELSVLGPDAPCDGLGGFTLRECLLVDFPDRAPEAGVALRPAVRVARALALARRGLRAQALAELDAAKGSAEAAAPPALLARGLAGDRAALLAASQTAGRDVAPEAGVLFARALAREARYPEAVKVLDGVAARWPAHPQAPEAAFLAAALVRDAGGRPEAIARWRKLAARPGPRAEESRWWAGWTLVQSGDAASAVKEWEPLARNNLSSLAPQCLYWQGVLGGDAAKLREAAALEGAGYYSLWVEQRLGTRAPLAPAQYPPNDMTGAPPADGGGAAGLAGLPQSPRVARARALLEIGRRDDAAAEALADLEIARSLPAPPAAPPASAPTSAAAAASPGVAPAWTPLLALVTAAGRPDRAMSAAVNTVGERVVPGADGAGTALLRHVYPAAYPDAIGPASAATALDPWLLTALARRESRFDAAAASPAGAQGLFQLMPKTARLIAFVAGTDAPEPAELLTADGSAPFAAWYLSDLYGRFGHPAIALAAYNAGPGSVEKWVAAAAAPAAPASPAPPSTAPAASAPPPTAPMEMDRWIEEIPYRETRIYVKTTLAAWHAYHHLYGGEAPALDPKLPPAPRDGARF